MPTFSTTNPYEAYIAKAREEFAKARTDYQRAMARGELLRWLRYAVVHRDGTRCTYCGIETIVTRRGHPFRRTVDHLTPVSAGGDDTLENLVLACQSCNSRRGNRPVRAFALVRGAEGGR